MPMLRILVLAAVLPAVYLLVKVYQTDRLEKEPLSLLLRLVLLGIFSTLLASVTERLGMGILNRSFSEETVLYDALLYFVVVALSEEGFKYLLLKRATWNSPHFDCQFDGVVYATFTSLGFALWENISYVFQYGLGTAAVRALTAVPGHACFGVFMGVWYGVAKRYEISGQMQKARRARHMAVLIPMVLHGTYDFIASMSQSIFVLIFIAFILVMFFAANRMVKKASQQDQYMI